ncbi:MAG: hypothetical protein WBV74_11155 [Pseudonocardiaceae bacterium]
MVPDDVQLQISGTPAVAEETKRFAARAQAGALALIDGAPGILIAQQAAWKPYFG